MSVPSRETVLCVDDEPHILEGLKRILRRRYEVLTATSGVEALDRLQDSSLIAVIIADGLMPGMDGATFLARARELFPDVSRILLTGQTSITSAVEAVNKGNIFKFLLKPCSPQVLLAAVEAATREYHGKRSRPGRPGIDADPRIVTGQDPITGLIGRDELLQRLETTVLPDGAADRPQWAVLFVEVQGLSDLVDAADASLGAQFLSKLARALEDQFRDALYVSRWGAEEFVVVAGAAQANDDALASRSRAWLRSLARILGMPEVDLRLSAHVGIARWPRDSTRMRAVIRHAEIAAQQVRRLGADSVCVYRSEWTERVESRQLLAAALGDAIRRGGLHLQYQPIIDLENHRVYALECLARWTHPTLGSISPETFIPLAEESGLMERLGEWILTNACREARHFIGPECPRFSVNVAERQLVQVAFPEMVRAALAEHGLDGASLVLEITESVAAQHVEWMSSLYPKLQSLGVTFAIDDFGTGYSTLPSLSRIPAAVIKVDLVFVRDFEAGGEAVIASALSLARDRGMQVVIEGIEHEISLQRARRLGAKLVQGYLVAPPMDAPDVAAWAATFMKGPGANDRPGPSAPDRAI